MHYQFPIQIEPGQGCDVTYHPQLRPLMFGGMYAKEDQLVFNAQHSGAAALELMLLRTSEQPVNVHIY